MKQPTKPPLLTLMQISDLHFGPPWIQEVAEAARQSAFDLGPDVMIVSGDLTQRAKRDQFQAARTYLDSLPSIPTLVIPGNHDVPLYRVAERWFRPHELYQEIIQADLNPILKLDQAVIVGLDSTAPRSAISNGRIHRWQLDYCAEAFAGTPPEAARIVVAHHHFAPAPDSLRDSSMPHTKRAMMRFVELDVDLILGGHLHRSYIGNSLDFYPGTHREQGIIICQSGTTTSRRGRGREQEKNTFNLVRVYEEFIEITHYLYFDENDGFVANSQHRFSRGRALTNGPSES